MRTDFTKGKSARSLEIACRALPVLAFYASVMGDSITYQELGELTGTFHRSFRHPFSYIHQWIRILEVEIGEEIPPIPLLVFEKGKSSPAAGGVEWLLRNSNLNKEQIDSLPFLARQVLIDGVVIKVKKYTRWNDVLSPLDLAPYAPQKTSIENITLELANRGGAGESPEHRKMKQDIARSPDLVGIRREEVARTHIEFIFPSLDRADILFEMKDSKWICVEVKTFEADEPEITRGFYQCLKYTALAKGLKRDLAQVPSVRSLLAMQGRLTPSLAVRRRTLKVDVIEAVLQSR